MEVGKKIKRRAACFDIKVAWLALARMYNHEALKGEITANTGFVLLHIDEATGTPATRIATLMGMESRSLTRMLNSMVEKGLICRKSDPYDRRLVRIFLTELGMEKKALAKQVVINFNKELYAKVADEKMETFFEVIDTMHQIINNKS